MPLQVPQLVLFGPEVESEVDSEDNAYQEICDVDELPPSRLKLDGEADQEEEIEITARIAIANS